MAYYIVRIITLVYDNRFRKEYGSYDFTVNIVINNQCFIIYKKCLYNNKYYR